jgi:hypothetical protein
MTTLGRPGVGVVVVVGEARAGGNGVRVAVAVGVWVGVEVSVATGCGCVVGVGVAIAGATAGVGVAVICMVGRGAGGAAGTVCEPVGDVIGVIGKSGRSVAVGSVVSVGVGVLVLFVGAGPVVEVEVGEVGGFVGTGVDVFVGVEVGTTLVIVPVRGGPWAKESARAWRINVATTRVTLITSGNKATCGNRLTFMGRLHQTFKAPLASCPGAILPSYQHNNNYYNTILT